MPVTFFNFCWLLGGVVMIVLTAKPKQNDVASAKIINVVFFIECLFYVVSSSTLTTDGPAAKLGAAFDPGATHQIN